MPSIKIGTFNIEWMFSLFNADQVDWDGTIPDAFPGKRLGSIRLEAIDDVKALCRRIAAVITGIDADILGIQEGPPFKEQMELFVRNFLNDEYIVHSSNPRSQTVHALVRRSIADKVTSIPHDDQTMKKGWTGLKFQAWSTIALFDRKNHYFYRRPLVLHFAPDNEKQMTILIVHTKSKFSMLKYPHQWDNREADAVYSAITARQKLSAEVFRLREYAGDILEDPSRENAVLIMGDINDGPLAGDMEREFLIHNVLDELMGSFARPDSNFKHAMTQETLETASTTAFPNPFKNNEMTHILIDHILVSPGIWGDSAPFSIRPGSCVVESSVFNAQDEDTGPDRVRQLRPSDHKPVSCVVGW